MTYSVIDQMNKKDIEEQNINFILNSKYDTRMYIIHKIIKEQLKNQRQGNACTKTRSEIRGGGKKPWKQKGTGRARAGSTRSPLWRGGGVIFGPKKKKYQSKINKKEKILATKILLYNKYKYTTVVKNLFHNINVPNTKEITNTLQHIGFNINEKDRLLIIVKNKTKPIYLSIRNIKNVELIEAKHLNTLSIIKADQLIISNEALKLINQIYNEKNTQKFN